MLKNVVKRLRFDTPSVMRVHELYRYMVPESGSSEHIAKSPHPDQGLVVNIATITYPAGDGDLKDVRPETPARPVTAPDLTH